MLISRFRGSKQSGRAVAGIRTPARRSPGEHLCRKPPARPETRAVVSSTTHSGAVRVSDIPQKRSLHRGKLILALAGIAATFAWLTGATSHPTDSTADQSAANGNSPTPEILHARIAAPTFFFDDASNALTELNTALSRTVPDSIISPLADPDPSPPVQVTALQKGLSHDTSESIPTEPADVTSLPGETSLYQTKQLADKQLANKKPTATRDEGYAFFAPETLQQATAIPQGTAAAPSLTLTGATTPVATMSGGISTESTEPTEPLPVESSMLIALKKLAQPDNGLKEITVTVQRGDTLSGILNKYGVSIEQMPQLLGNNLVKDQLSNLEIGQQFRITQMPNDDFHSLTARIGGGKRVTIKQSSKGLAISSIDLPVKRERIVASGTIQQSLYLAAERANLKQSTIMELADIFQWELDFARDIRKGDRFSMVYDKLYREDEYIGDGDILAAEFVRGGKTHTAIRFTTADGKTGYFSPNGKSKQRTFLRHPVDVVRITSRFNPNRLHPVLHKIRAHRGVDYGAPYGSPIYATADGTVKYSGAQNAYGNTVILQHGEKFSTLYAHMSKISSKSQKGKRVRQGDVIGYVGKSGRVTGVHLHYEFRVNGVQIDPLAIELPAAEPIDKKYLTELKNLSAVMQELMRDNGQHSEQIVAQIDDATGGSAGDVDKSNQIMRGTGN